mmetsp:Transcript_19343/g.44857  ORF Transcript_19343/g.44857 Transcript_19343/m.44857 type:complete len:235 (+) Transcript_19343:530-1234(+)
MPRFVPMAPTPTPTAARFETKALSPRETTVRFRQRRLPLGFATTLLPMLLLLSSSFFLGEGFASGTVGRNGCCQSCTNHLYRYRYRYRYHCSQQQQEQQQQQSRGQGRPMDFGGAVVGGRKQTQRQTQTQRSATTGDLTTEHEQPNTRTCRKKRYGVELRRARREERLQVRRQRVERQERGLSAASSMSISSMSISSISLLSRTVVGPLVRSLVRIRSKLSSIWIAFRYWLSRS